MIRSQRHKLYAAIHTAAAKAGLDDDSYRQMLAARCDGRTSAKDLTDRQLIDVLNHLNGGRPYVAKARSALARKVHALWRECAECGAIADGSRAALRSFCSRMTPDKRGAVIDPDLADDADLIPIIEALKAMISRHGGYLE